MSKRNLGSKLILGSNLAFLLRKQSKTFFEIGEILEFFWGAREHRPPLGASKLSMVVMVFSFDS